MKQRIPCGFSGCSSSSTGPSVKKSSRFSKPILSPAMAARRALLRRIQKRALNDLRSLLPNLKHRQRPDEVTIVREAAKYIDQLEATVLARLNSGSLTLKSVSSHAPWLALDEIRQRFLNRRQLGTETDSASMISLQSPADEKA